MTRFLMAVHGAGEIDEAGNYGSRDEMEKSMAATAVYNDELKAKGYWVFAGGLVSASEADVVDGRGETPIMTDGPYAETKEYLAGFWVIDVPDHDTALEVAVGASKACGGRIEVRAFDAHSQD